MKKILISMMAIAAFIITVNAQQPVKLYKHHHGKMMMMKELNLTGVQKAQLKTNHESYKKQLMELNKNEDITVKEARDKKELLRKEQKEKMMSILTADQKNKLAQLKKDRQAKHEAMALKRLDKMKANLNLSDSQVAKINIARQAAHEQFKNIAHNKELSRTEKKEQLMALKEQNKNTFKSILTADQLLKIEELKKQKIEKKQAR